VVVVGLLLYIVGRSQEILMFEVGSLIWLLIGILLLMRGGGAVKAQWFALFFMLFMIPLPGAIVDTVTMPMKIAVSYAPRTSSSRSATRSPAPAWCCRSGSTKLLVADACAGLHTLFSLEALGLLYLNIIRSESWFRNIALAILIVPISFTANVIRVMVLTLITYHLGDEAGQGFLHGFAGMVLFLSALLLIIGVDSLLQAGVRIRRQHRKQQSAPAAR
jgi:exosortase B